MDELSSIDAMEPMLPEAGEAALSSSYAPQASGSMGVDPDPITGLVSTSAAPLVRVEGIFAACERGDIS